MRTPRISPNLLGFWGFQNLNSNIKSFAPVMRRIWGISYTYNSRKSNTTNPESCNLLIARARTNRLPPTKDEWQLNCWFPIRHGGNDCHVPPKKVEERDSVEKPTKNGFFWAKRTTQGFPPCLQTHLSINSLRLK